MVYRFQGSPSWLIIAVGLLYSLASTLGNAQSCNQQLSTYSGEGSCSDRVSCESQQCMYYDPDMCTSDCPYPCSSARAVLYLPENPYSLKEFTSAGEAIGDYTRAGGQLNPISLDNQSGLPCPTTGLFVQPSSTPVTY